MAGNKLIKIPADLHFQRARAGPIPAIYGSLPANVVAQTKIISLKNAICTGKLTKEIVMLLVSAQVAFFLIFLTHLPFFVILLLSFPEPPS